MTSGVRTSGATDGLNHVYYVEKTWNGVNYPKVKPLYEVIDTSFDESFLRVRCGKKYIVVKHRTRFLRRRISPLKRSLVVEHPYDVTIWRKNAWSYEYFYPPFNQWIRVDGITNGIDAAGSFNWTSNDSIALIGKLRESVAGSDFNAGVFLGEGHEALSMIADSARRIALGLRYARKGNFVAARRALVAGSPRSRIGRKTVASNWLELQYGWLPLLKDAESAAQFLAHQFSAPLQHVVTVRSSKKPGSWGSTSPPNCTFQSNVSWSRGQIKAVLKEKDVIALSGLTDPLSVAWELVPYSFVIDWFIPIGNYLSARGLAQSLTGTFVTTRTDFMHLSNPKSNNYQWRGPTDKAYYEKIVVSRSVSTTLDIPTPSVKGLDKVASWRHCANAVALLLQLR